VARAAWQGAATSALLLSSRPLIATETRDPEVPTATAPAAKPLAGPAEPTKRLIIDLPVRLHKRLKLGAVERDQTIGNVIRELIAREFPD
jgi:hypothetical protein